VSTETKARRVPRCALPPLLAGQKALVTGASSGIGKAIAIALGQSGADVLVNWHSEQKEAEEVAQTIREAGVKAFPHQADVSQEDQVAGMFERMRHEFNGIDILVSNAGLEKNAPFDEMTLADWNTVIGVNLTGQFLCCREAVRAFKRQGHRAEVSRAMGKIICISSVHEVIPWAGHVNYAASKGGVMLLMKSLAQEVAHVGIRVNSICPGAIRTPINKDAWTTEESFNDLMRLIPYKRIGEPEDVAKTAVWLASDDSDYITGASIFVDGGMLLYPGFADGG
jgi:glucose 1-dehydrogenase